LAVFVRSAAAGIAAASTAMPVLDAIVFTGGIGEHSAPIRGRIARRLATLGVASPSEPPEAARDDRLASAGDRVLSRSGDGPLLVRIAAREDVVVAEATARIVGAIRRPTPPGPG
jgi:acetate kinase